MAVLVHLPRPPGAGGQLRRAERRGSADRGGRDHREPQGPASLLTVHVGDELGGFARCRTISFADPQRFTELISTAPDSVMEQVDMALRAALSL